MVSRREAVPVASAFFAKGFQVFILKYLTVADGMTRINVKLKDPEETEINGMGPVITERDLQALYKQLQQLEKEAEDDE